MGVNSIYLRLLSITNADCIHFCLLPLDFSACWARYMLVVEPKGGQGPSARIRLGPSARFAENLVT